MEPNETLADLAARFADEDSADERSRRFAVRLDDESKRTGVPRSKLAAFYVLGSIGSLAATRVA